MEVEKALETGCICNVFVLLVIALGWIILGDPGADSREGTKILRAKSAKGERLRRLSPVPISPVKSLSRPDYLPLGLRGRLENGFSGMGEVTCFGRGEGSSLRKTHALIIKAQITASKHCFFLFVQFLPLDLHSHVIKQDNENEF